MRPDMSTPDTPRGMERIALWERPIKEIFIDREKVHYHGLFELRAFRPMIVQWAKQNHYILDEIHGSELVEEESKDIHIHFLLQKKLAEYYFSVITMEVHMEHLKDKEVKLSGKSRTLQGATVEVTFNGFLMSFLQYRWESKPWFYFLRTVIDKFVYKIDRNVYQNQLISDAGDLMNKTQAFFLLYQQRTGNIHELKEESDEGKKGGVGGEQKGEVATEHS
ncbi:hypothetical protein HYS48_04580 [Candidatus Woesearchaeota archaeon]|nr:hypothetical protein [Candidatus Woesearchaeota archaeon]